MSKQVQKVCSAVSTVVVALAVILALLLVGVRLVGLRPMCVLSGSMEPTYHTGSLIYVRPCATRSRSYSMRTWMSSHTA